MDYFLTTILPALKDIMPWVVVLGGAVKWYFSRKSEEEDSSINRIEALSKVEERLRESLQKQLELTQAKLDTATKELERVRKLLIKYETELARLRSEIQLAGKK